MRLVLFFIFITIWGPPFYDFHLYFFFKFYLFYISIFVLFLLCFVFALIYTITAVLLPL